MAFQRTESLVGRYCTDSLCIIMADGQRAQSFVEVTFSNLQCPCFSFLINFSLKMNHVAYNTLAEHNAIARLICFMKKLGMQVLITFHSLLMEQVIFKKKFLLRCHFSLNIYVLVCIAV